MTDEAATETGGAEGEPARPKTDWADPNIPPGDSPVLPAWPLIVSVVAFCLWFVFLVAMAVVRIKTTPY